MDRVVVHGVTKIVEVKDTYEYVPIIAVIQAMLHNSVIYKEVCKSEVIAMSYRIAQNVGKMKL